VSTMATKTGQSGRVSDLFAKPAVRRGTAPSAPPIPATTARPSRAMAKYRTYILKLPAPGHGAHRAIFGAGCLGARAGLAPDHVMNDLENNFPPGDRELRPGEIEQGVNAAYRKHLSGESESPPPPPAVAPDKLKQIIREGKGMTEEDIRARSPVDPGNWGWEQALRVLKALYAPDELLFVGDDHIPGRLGTSIRPVGRLIRETNTTRWVLYPKIMVNPLTGQPGNKKDGGHTLRGDSCVRAYRFVVAESDDMPVEDQLAFWGAVPHLPISALVMSGGKSVHAWLRVDCRDATGWEEDIRLNLYPRFLVPLGMDKACKNESRLSRMPGHRRIETRQVQRCIYLAPQGKAVRS
jgi:hypothetical protein